MSLATAQALRNLERAPEAPATTRTLRLSGTHGCRLRMPASVLVCHLQKWTYRRVVSVNPVHPGARVIARAEFASKSPRYPILSRCVPVIVRHPGSARRRGSALPRGQVAPSCVCRRSRSLVNFGISPSGVQRESSRNNEERQGDGRSRRHLRVALGDSCCGQATAATSSVSRRPSRGTCTGRRRGRIRRRPDKCGVATLSISKGGCESPRVSRRLLSLRGWGHGQSEQVPG